MKKPLIIFKTSVQGVCADMPVWMSRVVRIAFTSIVGLLLSAMAIGCANSQTAYPYHGLDISNWGSARVEQIEVRYGELVRVSDSANMHRFSRFGNAEGF